MAGIISITFDDGDREQYTIAFPLMRDRNIVGTFYIPTAPFPDSTYNKISPSELLEMQNSGNEIGSHSVNHLDFNTLTDTQMRQECENSKATLQSYGLNVNNFAYPFGTGDLSYANTIVSQYYRSARTTYWDSIPLPLAQFGLPAVYGEWGSDDVEVLDSLKTMIDRTVADNRWTIFYFHYGDRSYFPAFLDYAKASGAQILTVDQVVNPIIVTYPCPYGDATFNTQADLDAHILAVHDTQKIVFAGKNWTPQKGTWGVTE